VDGRTDRRTDILKYYILILILNIIARGYASAVYAVVVCMSVSPSVTSWHCTKTAKHRIIQIAPHDSPGTVVFWCHAKTSANFQRSHPKRGRQIEVRKLKAAIFYKNLAIS